MPLHPHHYFTKQQRIKGFTIVELLIVIVIIAILASITVTAYSGVQNRALDSAIKSDLSSFAKKAEIYYIDNNAYPAWNNTSLTNVAMRFSNAAYSTTVSSNVNYCTMAGNTGYVLGVTAKNGQKYYISSANTSPQEYVGAYNFYGTGGLGSPCLNLADISGVPATGGYSGFVLSDTTTGPWRSWTGITN